MKRIITCSDGTWNQPNSGRTNVQKIFDMVEKNDTRSQVTQIKFYDEGIGAKGNLFTRMIDGATGNGIDENIQDVYKFICWNYEPDDEIYLFGFSRGAYTARSLAGLIRKCGIIKINDLDLIADAYKLYRDKENGPDSDIANDFRRINSYDVSSIKFIGVWDTVGSLGIPISFLQWNKNRYTFHDTTLSSIIEFAYHALAVDESRKSFVPTLWVRSKNKAREFNQVLEQRWFAGVHSNVGGGYPDSGLSDIALKWLLQKAENAGLCLSKEFGNFKDNCEGELYNSREGIFSLLPKTVRKIEVDNVDSFVDESVYERMKRFGAKYKPVNVPEQIIIPK